MTQDTRRVREENDNNFSTCSVSDFRLILASPLKPFFPHFFVCVVCLNCGRMFLPILYERGGVRSTLSDVVWIFTFTNTNLVTS